MAKKPHSDTRTGSHLSSSKSSGCGTSTSFSDTEKKGSQWDGIPDGIQSKLPPYHLHPLCRLVSSQLLRSFEKHSFQ